MSELNIKDLAVLDPVFGWLETESPTERSGGLRTYLELLGIISGHQRVKFVNDTETTGDWTASGATFTKTVGATNKRTLGTNTLALATVSPTADGTEYVTTSVINNSAAVDQTNGVDWRDLSLIGFWQFSAGFNGAGELKLQIKNDGSWSDSVNVPYLTAANVHQYAEVDISSLARDKVQQIRFVNGNSTNSETIYIDQIIAYKLGNSKGPVLGNCAWFAVKNGVAMSKGDLVNFEDGYVDVAASGDEEVIGICVIGGTGSAETGVQALVQIGGLAVVEVSAASTTLGYSVYATAARTCVVATVGESDQAFAKLVDDNGAASGDFVWVLLNANGTTAVT